MILSNLERGWFNFGVYKKHKDKRTRPTAKYVQHVYEDDVRLKRSRYFTLSRSAGYEVPRADQRVGIKRSSGVEPRTNEELKQQICTG